MAKTEITGSSTPPIKKPVIAGVKAVPAWAPITGGKIRFPAPKNIENRVSDTAISETLPACLDLWGSLLDVEVLADLAAIALRSFV